MSLIASTYKHPDVEETIDVWFFRPLGYLVARACVPLGVTPNAVTIVSIFIGVTGGHLLYYRDFAINVWGVVLWVIADILDSADGQLARITGHKSKVGRILDGLGGNIMFVSIYLHLLARTVQTYPGIHPAWFFLLVLAGGLSHSLQSSLADYYRMAYLKFVVDPSNKDLEGSDDVRREYESVSFTDQPARKFLMRIYLNYTMQQESLSRHFQVLRKKVDSEFSEAIPVWFSDAYRAVNLPLMKYYAILTTNTRIIILSVCVLIDVPWLYFAAEVVGINAVMLLVILRQEKISARLIHEIDARKVPA